MKEHHMTRQIVTSPSAPKALGPYSHANRSGNLVFCSGQLGLDPASGTLVEGGIQAQTRQALANLSSVLQTASSSLQGVLKTTVFLADMNDFAAMNAVYGEHFPAQPPARTTIAALALPRGALVEIECIAEAVD
jgi:2-iminobutanoate/2-iminopropanoate deaminase